MPRRVKVAVIGSGLAGLTAAYTLTQPNPHIEFELHLFEKAPTLGMDSSSISLPITGKRGKSWRIDVPMRSFQGGYYPQLIALYKHLGVAFRKADFSYSFSLFSPSSATQARKINTTMIYNGSSGRAGLSMPSILKKPYYGIIEQGILFRAAIRAWTVGLFILSTIQIAICYLWMLFHALPFWRKNTVERITFGEWAEQVVPTSVLAKLLGLDLAWRNYTNTILLPLFSAVCTAPVQDVLQHPVEEFLDYIWLTFGTHHYVAVYGVQDVVSRLTTAVQNIHLSSTIFSVISDPQNPHLAAIHCDTPKGRTLYAGFHHIIFATQATRAIPLLASYQSSLQLRDPKRKAVEDQIQCLRTFEYRPTIVINHTDPMLMPDEIRDRRELNLIYLDQQGLAISIKEPIDYHRSSDTVPSSYTMTTHVLNPPKEYPPHLPAVYQTTNPIIPPEKSCVLSIAKLERAVLTVKSKEALKGLYKKQRRKWWQSVNEGVYHLGVLQGAGRLSNIQGPGLWICGSFAYGGIPLLEGCVVSARGVVEQGVWKSEGVELGCPPW